MAKSRYSKLSLELKAAIQKVSVSEAEKGQAGVNDFNLDEFLHGICRELGENSKKTKRLGVLWQDLHVEVHLFPYHVCVHVIEGDKIGQSNY